MADHLRLATGLNSFQDHAVENGNEASRLFCKLRACLRFLGYCSCFTRFACGRSVARSVYPLWNTIVMQQQLASTWSRKAHIYADPAHAGKFAGPFPVSLVPTPRAPPGVRGWGLGTRLISRMDWVSILCNNYVPYVITGRLQSLDLTSGLNALTIRLQGTADDWSALRYL